MEFHTIIEKDNGKLIWMIIEDEIREIVR